MKVFVSATSGDLKSCRDVVKDVLLQGDIQPVTQEVLRADHRNLPEFLDSLVQSCDAVVCLVGNHFGAAPEDEPHRSYTQREFDCSKKLGKPVFVFLANDEFNSGNTLEQSEQESKWQNEHYQALMGESYCRTFGTQMELAKEVGVSIWTVRRAAGRIPMHFYHLPSKPPFFSGRVDEISQLSTAMANTSSGIIAIVGMAGQGKSTLVHHVVDSRQEDASYPFHAGFWCTAGLGGFTFDIFLDEALSCLTEEEFDKTAFPRTQQRVQRLLGEMQKRPVLIVIDAIERWLQGWESADIDPDEIMDEDRLAAVVGLDEFLEQVPALRNGSHLVLTSRAMPDVLEDVEKTVIPVRKPTDYDVGLQGLTPGDAVAMLRSFEIDASDEQLIQIAAQLGFHPLALRVYGGYVKKKYGGVLENRADIQKWDRRKTLAKLFDEVYDRLPGGASSRRFLEVASCTIEDAPLEAMEAALNHGDSDSAGVRDTALLLADWQVIGFDARSGAVGMHALLKEHFGKHLSDSERSHLHGRFSDWYSKQPSTEEPTVLTDIRSRLLALEHSIQARDLECCEQIVWGEVTPLYSLIEWLGAHGHFVHGAEIMGKFAAVADDPLRARVLIARSALLRPAGRHDEAIDDLNEAITALEVGDDDHPGLDLFDLAGALSNRGTAHLELAQYQRSKEDFDRAIGMLLKMPEDDSCVFQLAAIRANRAMVLREIGRVHDAIDDCTLAIEAYQSRLEPVYQQLDVDLASAFSNRGNAYRDIRRFEEALLDYNDATQIHSNLVNIGQTQHQGPMALDRVLSGSALSDLNRHDEAISELDQAIATYGDLIRAGNKVFQQMLAFAQMRRAWSLSATGKMDESARESGAASKIYARLAEEGRRDVQGPYAHSMLIDSVVRDRAGDHEGAEACWASGMELTNRLIESGETDLRRVVLRYSLVKVQEYAESRPAQAEMLVTTALDVIDSAFSHDELDEGLAEETRHAIAQLRSGTAADLRLNQERITNLEMRLGGKA